VGSAGRRATSTDVAREAGVSRATVSYVLNDTPNQTIADTTRRRVRDAAARLGYKPSAAAKALRRGRSDVVLGLLPDWPVGHAVGLFVQHAATAFARHGLTFVVHPSTTARSLAGTWEAIAPVAVLALDRVSEEGVAEMRAAGVEVIIALHSGGDRHGGELQWPEDPVGALQAHHLARTHGRLGYAYPDDGRVEVFARPRLQGVRRVCAELGLPEPLVRTVPMDPDRAADAVRAWTAAEPPVTAVCAYNDEVASAVLAGARVLGVRVPDDLAVVGVDDSPAAAVTCPPLTTVVQDLAAIAEHHARGVVAALAGQPMPDAPPGGEYRLRVRESG
jgi:DNA-binding LacI/PurR family transcriptional regulator